AYRGERAERVESLQAACRELAISAKVGGRVVRLAQALPEPDEPWAVSAYLDAGFMKVGDLVYMRRPFAEPLQAGDQSWPSGVQVRPVTSFEADRGALIEGLDRTYR